MVTHLWAVLTSVGGFQYRLSVGHRPQARPGGCFHCGRAKAAVLAIFSNLETPCCMPTHVPISGKSDIALHGGNPPQWVCEVSRYEIQEIGPGIADISPCIINQSIHEMSTDSRFSRDVRNIFSSPI